MWLILAFILPGSDIVYWFSDALSPGAAGFPGCGPLAIFFGWISSIATVACYCIPRSGLFYVLDGCFY